MTPTPPLDEMGTLVTTLLGNLQLARRAYTAGAIDQPIAAWLREAETAARQIGALRQRLLDREADLERSS